MMRVWVIVGIGVAILAVLLFWLAGERPDALASEGKQIHLVYLLILLVLVGSGLVVRWRDLRNLKWLKHGLIWTALGLILVAGYSYRTDMASVGTRTLAELMPGRAIETAPGTAVIRAGDDRHFRIDSIVDGAPVRFLLDTGASMVVLNRRDALAVGLDLDKLSFTQRTQTANGIGFGAPVRLRSIKVGPIVVRNVPALVNQAPMSTSLLGVSFLDRLSSYSVQDKILTLTQ